ncbi:collagen alpha-1(III) chain-like [Onychostruthus taczanowskii]|uniref:collagen alpha-1(III) chain-like n=1 Tax=Onychostruthus taczanowskii TaxID=356909 RepID=UPI001B80D2B6|nr:collagen alpha-1(III) chain-like [Onychostruthus taczanowskii]
MEQLGPGRRAKPGRGPLGRSGAAAFRGAAGPGRLEGTGCRRGKGLPPPPCSQSITGCDPAPLRRRAHRGMGWHGSPFQQCQAPLSSSAASFASRGGANRKGSGEEAPTTSRAFVSGRAPRCQGPSRRAGTPCPAPPWDSPERGLRVLVVS